MVRQTFVKPYDFKADTMNKKILSQGLPGRGKGKRKEARVLPVFCKSAGGYCNENRVYDNRHIRQVQSSEEIFKNSFRVIEQEKLKT
jgi:hypothetical protein